MQPRLAILTVLLAGVLIAAPPAWAGQGEQTATQFYTEYRTAFDKAESIDDLKPYMSAATLKQIDETPAEERAMMFEVIKMMGKFASFKVVKEARTAEGATLTVEAVRDDGEKATGTIEVVKENGAWRIGRERWAS